MAVSAAAVAKAAAMLLTNEKTRKGLGWILVAIFSPVILLIALLCSLGSGGAEHNNYSVEACFYGAEFSAEVPAEFRYHIEEMRSAFSLLDSAVSSANGQMDSGNSLDPIRVKAVFYALCFGDDAPSTRAANSFVECFYTTETRTRTVEVTLEDGTTSTEEEEYTAAVPVSLSQAYANLEAHLGREITDDDKSNIDHIYTMIAGSAGGGSYSGEYLRGDGSSIELDISAFTDPTTKNAADLVTYAIHAWESGWGYVWGTYGSVLTDSLFAYKLEQYPDGVGSYADFIRANWLGGRTTDCVGLIKGYGWLNPDTMTIEYGTNGMPDLGANQMYYNASVSVLAHACRSARPASLRFVRKRENGVPASPSIFQRSLSLHRPESRGKFACAVIAHRPGDLCDAGFRFFSKQQSRPIHPQCPHIGVYRTAIYTFEACFQSG